MHFASVRLSRLKNGRQIQAASDHANRLDDTSRLRVRPDADSGRNFASHPWREDGVCGGLRFDYLADLRCMQAATGAIQRGNTAPVGHLICVVSVGWLMETGDQHDPQNPRNRLLFDAAIAWAQKTFGETSLLSARMDLDEKGAGVVDVFVAPMTTSKTGKKFLAVNPTLTKLQAQYKTRNTFAALQDSWTEFVRANLDPTIERGREKEARGPDRLSPEAYAAKAETEKAREFIRSESDELDRLRSELVIADNARIAAEQAVAERERRCAATEAALEQRRLALETAAAKKLTKAGKRLVESFQLGMLAWLDGRITLVQVDHEERYRVSLTDAVSDADVRDIERSLRPAVELGLARLLAAWQLVADELGVEADEVKNRIGRRSGLR